MKSILTALILTLTSFNALAWEDNNSMSPRTIHTYRGSLNLSGNPAVDEVLIREDVERYEEELEFEYARSRLEDKRINGEIKGEITDEMVLDYYHDWNRDY